MSHLLSVDDLSRSEILALLGRAAALRSRRPANLRPFSILLAFFQSSTRTRIGFAGASARLGGTPIELVALRDSPGMSAAESIADSVRCASGQVDLVVLRHGNQADHAAAVRASVRPVLNAGDGPREHPTQALLDLFAMHEHLGHLEGLRVGLVGDLGARAAHSLVRALRPFDPAEMRLMHPPGRELAPRWLEAYPRGVVGVEQRLRPDDLDVLYMVGLPEGQGESSLPESVRARWRLTPEIMARLPGHAVVLCPLPRIDEIDTAVDGDPRCRYFNQSDDGLWVRMAVLERFLARAGEDD